MGVSPQVIGNTGALGGMAPLQHAAATVIKLNGDYADLLQRNTVDELADYPGEWITLLDRVLSEYGLLISGWSADWDHALVSAIERLPVRRYPLFWDARSAKGENAKRLLAMQGGTVAAWAGHSVAVLMRVYASSLHGHQDHAMTRIEALVEVTEEGEE